MTVDVVAAKQLQALMDDMTGVMTTKRLRDLKITGDALKDKCNFSVHKHTGTAAEQLEGDHATNEWYANSKHYSYETGKAKTGVKDQKDEVTKQYSDTYTQLVWKTSKKVGFGIKGKFVVAWYCDKKGNTGDANTFTDNVCKVDGCHPDGWKGYTLEKDFSLSDADKKDKTITNEDCGLDKWCPYKGGDKKTKARHCGTHIDSKKKTITEKCVDYDKCETKDGDVTIGCLWRHCDPFTYRGKFADNYQCKMDKCATKDGKFVRKGDLGTKNSKKKPWDYNTFSASKSDNQGRCGTCKSYEKSRAASDVYKYIAEDFKLDQKTPITDGYKKQSYGKGSLSPCQMCPFYQKRDSDGNCKLHECKEGEINVRDGTKQGDCIKIDCLKVEDGNTYDDQNKGKFGSGYRGF